MRALRYFLFFLLLNSAAGEETLPRVLIIGDSIYQQPAAEVAKELKGRVELVYASRSPGEVCNTETALENLDAWLGEGKWDLIHFNFGLGDLVYRAPGMKSFRILPKSAGGVRAISASQYDKNLRELVKRLKATGAKLVWASTTPIRASSTGVFELKSEIEFNSIASKVMREQGVPVNDMYAYTLSLIDMTKPAGHGADPFNFDKKPIHPPIVETILNQLKLQP